MNTEDEKLLTRYLDGELSAPERTSFEGRLNADPDMRNLLDAHRGAGDLIRGQFLASMEVPHADFLQSRIMREIQEAPVSKAASGGGFWAWFSRPWSAALAGATACALIMLALLPREDRRKSGLAETYVPGVENGVKVNGYYLPEASATVVMIDGLPELPSDAQIGGFRFNVPTELRDRVHETGSAVSPLSRVAVKIPVSESLRAGL